MLKIFSPRCRFRCLPFDSLSKENKKMKYMLLIHDEEQAWGKLSESDRNALYAEYGQFGQSLQASGYYIAGAQFHPTSSATCFRLRDCKRLVTDGPFAQPREHLVGYS